MGRPVYSGGMPANNAPDACFQGEDARGIWIGASGHVRALTCFPLRDSVIPRLDGPGPVPPVTVDLSACTYMDSTFVGLLVAIDRAEKRAGGRLRMLAPTPACVEILAQLGLDRIFAPPEPGPWPVPVGADLLSADRPPSPEFLLEVHVALMEASGPARDKFGLLREVLEQRVARGKRPLG
jgi:anti-sigma B factor antagonist